MDTPTSSCAPHEERLQIIRPLNQSINRSIYKCLRSYLSICPTQYLSIPPPVSNHHRPYRLDKPHGFTLAVLQDSVEGGAGVRIKHPPHLSALIPPPLPSLRCCGEEGSNYSGVSVAGCDSSPGKGRRASITHRPATG